MNAENGKNSLFTGNTLQLVTQYQRVSTKEIHISKTVQTELFLCVCMCTHIHTYVHVITVNAKRGHGFEREKGEYMGHFTGRKKKGGMMH